MKICYRCKVSKAVSEFGLSSRFKDRLRKECKICGRVEALAYRNKHIEQQRQGKRSWAAANAERVLEYSRWYRKEHHEQTLANAMTAYWKYKAENPDRLLANSRRSGRVWRKTYPHKVNAKTARRYAAKSRATVVWANHFLMEEAYHLATLRTVVTGIEWHVDHIVPLRGKTVCGLHVEDNLQVIPAIVNVKKKNLSWPHMPESLAA